jgi:bacterial/archaeal transporter family protein
MNAWFWYAVGAAVLYGAHQIFTKLAANKISDGLGGFVVEASAALTILLYLAWLRFGGTWNQTSSAPGVWYSVLTGICVGVGTIFFFVLFQKGGPLSAVPMILAGGAALMAVAGILFFKEPMSWPRLLGILLSICGLFLLRR